jgi:hypothetical protein
VTDIITNRRRSKSGRNNNGSVQSSEPTSPRVPNTSIAAFEGLDPATKARREQKVFGFIKSNGGRTCWEVEVGLGLLHQSASSTITRLRRTGYLVDTGERRPTNTGRMATVWGAAQ